MLKKLFRKKNKNDGDLSISSPMEVVHAVHIDKEMNWTFDESVDPKTVFTKIKVIGKGGFGTVSQIIHRPSMKILAGKLINESLCQDSNSKEEIQHEIELMREVDSPYTVRYYGCVKFEGTLMILMEYIDRGSLRDILDWREQVLSEDQISCVMSDLLHGLKKIHSDFHILHRDIKAANLLLNSEGRVKIADFGVSRQFEGGKPSSTMTIVGTPYWMAPEVISGIAYSYPADVWSVGITAVELAEGAPPYVEYSPTKAMVEIATKGFPGYRFPQMHSPEFTDFVSHCVSFNQKDRWPVDKLLEHPFILRSSGYDRQAVMSDLIKDAATNLGVSSSSQLNSTLGSSSASPSKTGNAQDAASSSILQSGTPFDNFGECASAVLSQNLQSNVGTFVASPQEGNASFVFTPTPETADGTFVASGFNSFGGPADGMSSFVYNPNAGDSSGFNSFVITGTNEGMSSFMFTPETADSTFMASNSNVGTFVGPSSNEGMSSFVYTPTPETADSTFMASNSNVGTFVGPSSNEGMSSFVYTPTPETADSTFKASNTNVGTFVGPSSNEGMSSFVYTPTPETADSTFMASNSNVGTFVGPSSNEGMSSFVYTPTPETADSTFKASIPNNSSTSDFGTFVAAQQNNNAIIKEEVQNGKKVDRVTFNDILTSNRQTLKFEQQDDDTYLITVGNDGGKRKRNKKREEENIVEEGDDSAVSLKQIDNKTFMQISRVMSKQIPFSPLLIATNQDAPVETLYMPVDATMMNKKILPPLVDEDGVINMTTLLRHEKSTLICALALVFLSFFLFGSNGFFFLLGVSILTHMSVIFMSKRKERHEQVVKRAKEAREERNKLKVELAQKKKNKKMKKDSAL